MKQFFKVMMVFIVLYILLIFSVVDYYWIGGVGNWLDILYWVIILGGVFIYFQVFIVVDNVYFDVNFFIGLNQIIIINNENIFSRNMDWIEVIGFF